MGDRRRGNSPASRPDGHKPALPERRFDDTNVNVCLFHFSVVRRIPGMCGVHTSLVLNSHPLVSGTSKRAQRQAPATQDEHQQKKKLARRRRSTPSNLLLLQLGLLSSWNMNSSCRWPSACMFSSASTQDLRILVFFVHASKLFRKPVTNLRVLILPDVLEI